MMRAMAAVWIVLGVALAYADGRGYEPRTAPIYAGVGAFAPNDPNVRNHYTFYILERRTDVKPLGLTFVNPYASSGTTREQGTYWLVDLSRITDSQLARYRVILLSRTTWAGMTAEIREKLRRFVDSGGVLWIETPYAETPPRGVFNNLLFPEVAFAGGGGRISGGNLDHPIFRGYYQLSPSEIVQLGLLGRGLMSGTVPISGNPPLQPILLAGNGVVMAAGIYGSGRIVVSTVGIAAALNAPFGGGTVPRARDYLLQSVPDVDLKVAYNIVRWGASSTSDAFNVRRSNAVSDQYGAPLSVRWRNPEESPSPTDGSAVVYGGLVYVTIGNKLVCYDALPNRDLDGDGRTDDGLRDLEEGKPYDKVWEAPLGGRASAPVIVETSGGVLVLVQVGGTIVAFRAVPREGFGTISPQPQAVWTISNPIGSTAPTTSDGRVVPPIVIENTLLLMPSSHQAGVSQSAGFVAFLLDGVNQPRLIVGSGADGRWYKPRASNMGGWFLPPVAGLVPNRGRGGGNDIVVYLGTLASTGPGELNAIRAFWLGAKGEVLEPEIVQGIYQGYMRTRISGRARIYVSSDPTPLAPRVYRVRKDTGIFQDITDLVQFNMRGTLSEGGTVNIPQNQYSKDDVYLIDYYIDWGDTADNEMLRSTATLPESQTNSGFPANRLKGFTLGPNGVLYITTGTDSTDPNDANGNLIALVEQGQTTPRGTTTARGASGSFVLWRWQSHGGYIQPVRGSLERAVPGATIWREPNPPLDNFLNQYLHFNHRQNPDTRAMNFTFRHAPVYHDGAIYAIGEGFVTFRYQQFSLPIPFTILLAFDAEPEQFVIDLGAPIVSQAEIQISQWDYGRSGPSNQTSQISTLVTYSPQNPDPLIRVDYQRGQIRFLGFGSAGSGGVLGLLDRSLSISQPVVISFGPTETPVFIDPDAIPGNWNNLRWYAVILGCTARGAPVVVGDTIYLPASIQLLGNTVGSGILGIGADPYRLQPNLPARKAQAGTIPLSGSDYKSIIRWPYIDDLINESDISRSPDEFFREFITRFAQQLRLGGSIGPIGAGEGMLVVGSGEGLHAFSRQGTIIADEGRILEVDSASRVIWSTENTQLEIPSGALVSSKVKYPLTPNARVYRYGENELIVVEPERNRIAILDRAGNEIRTITRFIPDKVLLPTDGGGTQILEIRNPAVSPRSNYVSGMPDTLRDPTDVSVWTEFVPQSRNPYVNAEPLEYWIHYTISDSGNSRVVDIVDRYQADPSTLTIGPPVTHSQLGPMLGLLYWTTPSLSLGRNFKFVSAQRFEYWDGQQTRIGFATLVQNVSVEGYLASAGTTPDIDPATPNAGMITLHLIVNGQDQTLYIRKMQLPDGKIVPILAPVAIDTSRTSLAGDATGLFLLVTTSTGVYELQVPLTGNISDTLPVTWMLTNEAYSYALRRRLEGHDLVRGNDGLPLQPILFRPTQARYLFGGNALIVNSYSGETQVVVERTPQTRVFGGEVFEIRARDYNRNDTDLSDGTLYGFNPDSILWSTADRPGISGSSPLRKPSSADRGF